MPAVVGGLMRPCRPREEEGAPVGDAADHARGAQDDGACVASDSGGAETEVCGQ